MWSSPYRKQSRLKQKRKPYASYRRQRKQTRRSADHMGEGAEELGKILMKSFLYALTQQDELPDTILVLQRRCKADLRGFRVLEDLKDLAARGVEILTCGTCLNFYGITESCRSAV